MNEACEIVSATLAKSEYHVFDVANVGVPCLAFEDDICFGYILIYQKTDELLRNCAKDITTVHDRYKFQLRNSAEKSWNIYSVFLTLDVPSEEQKRLLSEIEEDLVGTRKIAQPLVLDELGVRTALISLFELQHAPNLEPFEMVDEIRVRISSLPEIAVEAFLAQAPVAEVIRLMGRRDET